MARKLAELYQIEEENGVLEFEQFRLFFVGTDPQPQHSCFQIQECYVTDEHFAWLEAKLRERPDVPCIFFTHAPPAGAALRTVPLVHVRATNAYLDQNHNFERWLRLIRDHQAIKMWFSAHYHLGHDFEDSSTYRNGVTFFHTGVHSSYSRDGKRQSRVIDIMDGAIRVSTLDHEHGYVRTTPDWSCNFQIWRTEISNLDSEPMPEDRGAGSCGIGQRDTVVTELVPVCSDGLLAVTNDGFMWEIHHRLEAILGTHHDGHQLHAVTLAEDGIWKAWGRCLKKSDPHHPDRFVRNSTEKESGEVLLLPEKVTALAPRHGGGVWAACGRHVFEVTGSSHSLMQAFTEGIVRMIPDDGNLYLLSDRGMLLKQDGSVYETGVTAWDRYQGEEVVIHREHGWVDRNGEIQKFKLPVSSEGSEGSHSHVSIKAVCLGEGRFVLLHSGRIFVWRSETGWLEQNTSRLATAISRMPGLSPLHFAAALGATDEDPRAQVKVWEIS